MGVGVSGANVADNWLKVLSGTDFTAPAGCYVQLHTENPGASGTSASSVETTRKQVSWNGTITSHVLSATSVPSWTSWPSGANGETVSHISVWSASSNGTFLFSGVLAVSKTVNTGDTLTLSTLTVAIPDASIAS